MMSSKACIRLKLVINWKIDWNICFHISKRAVYLISSKICYSYTTKGQIMPVCKWNNWVSVKKFWRRHRILILLEDCVMSEIMQPFEEKSPGEQTTRIV